MCFPAGGVGFGDSALHSFLSSGSMPITELSLKEGVDRLPSKAPQCDVNGRWAQVVTWEEAQGATHSQGIHGAHGETVDLRGTGNTSEGMVSESVVLFLCLTLFSSRLGVESFCGGSVPTLQGEAQAVIAGYWSQIPREPLRKR